MQYAVPLWPLAPAPGQLNASAAASFSAWGKLRDARIAQRSTCCPDELYFSRRSMPPHFNHTACEQLVLLRVLPHLCPFVKKLAVQQTAMVRSLLSAECSTSAMLQSIRHWLHLSRTVKHCARLRVDRDYRETSGSVLVAGATPLQEIASWAGRSADVQVLLLAPGAGTPPGDACVIVVFFLAGCVS